MSDEPERLQAMGDAAPARPTRRGRLRLGRRGREEQAATEAAGPRPYAETRLEDLVVITGY